MTPQEDAKDAEYWRRRWWHDRRKVYRHRWNMQRFDKHCVKCGQDAMGADDDCPCWKMRLPKRRKERTQWVYAGDGWFVARPQEDQPHE